MATVRVNRAQVSNLIGLSGPIGRRVQRFGNEVKRDAQRRVGVRSGKLRNSITVRPGHRGAVTFVRVGPMRVRYADLHHEGTRPHVITPRKAQVLKFKPRGSTTVVYRRRVNHPGTKPNRYMADAFNAALRRFSA